MKNKIAALAIATTLFSGVAVGTASAADARPANKPDTDCLRSGQAVLRDLGAFQAAAKGQVDYSVFADAEAGPIFADLEEGSFLPINVVFKLHLDSPELFAWCQ